MASAFRLTTRPTVSESMARFTVDFSCETAELQNLHFLPGELFVPACVTWPWSQTRLCCVSVPRAPEIDASSCVARDNTIVVAWQPACESDGSRRPIERFDVEYRKTDGREMLRTTGEACWEMINDITEPQVTISGETSQVDFRGHRWKLGLCLWRFLCF